MIFGGRVFGGRLFAGRLFGSEADLAAVGGVALPPPDQATLETLDPRRVREFWDELDAQRAPTTEVDAPRRAPPRPVGPAAPVASVPGIGADSATGAFEIVLPGGRRALLDPDTRAIVPAPGSSGFTDFTDEDMQAVLLALCLLDLDD